MINHFGTSAVRSARQPRHSTRQNLSSECESALGFIFGGGEGRRTISRDFISLPYRPALTASGRQKWCWFVAVSCTSSLLRLTAVADRMQVAARCHTSNALRRDNDYCVLHVGKVEKPIRQHTFLGATR